MVEADARAAPTTYAPTTTLTTAARVPVTDTLESDLEPTRLSRRERRAAAPLAYRRRNAELTLIIMAAAITAIAYTLASLGSNAEIPPASSVSSRSCSG